MQTFPWLAPLLDDRAVMGAALLVCAIVLIALGLLSERSERRT